MSTNIIIDNIIETGKPVRYFYINKKGYHGLVGYESGVPKENKLTKRLEYIGTKHFEVGTDQVVKTNNPAIIYWLQNNPVSNRYFEEMFLEEKREFMELAFKYNVNISEHSKTIKKAIENGDYTYTPPKNTADEFALEENKMKSFKLQILKAKNEKLKKLSEKGKFDEMEKILKETEILENKE